MKLHARLNKDSENIVDIIAYDKMPFLDRLKNFLGMGNLYEIKFVFYFYVVVNGEPKWVDIEETKNKFYTTFAFRNVGIISNGDFRSHEPLNTTLSSLGRLVLSNNDYWGLATIDYKGVGIREEENYHGLDDVLAYRLLNEPLPDNVPESKKKFIYTPGAYSCRETSTVYVGAAIPIIGYVKGLDHNLYSFRDAPSLTLVSDIHHSVLFNQVMHSVRECLSYE